MSFDRQELQLVGESGGLLQKGEDAAEVYDELKKVSEEKKEFGLDEPEVFGNGLSEWWASFDLRKKDSFADLDAIRSHLPSLDEQTQGFRRTEVAVLAGIPVVANQLWP